ncbi:hypothetical protein GCM10010393_44290 [Streptomyces gobitricini]|uniref:Uncharacterized protein n=1 Tax=Streptomyces gobitricini TaxID=68211 RepID=A0ABN3MQW6_9ACTN
MCTAKRHGAPPGPRSRGRAGAGGRLPMVKAVLSACAATPFAGAPPPRVLPAIHFPAPLGPAAVPARGPVVPRARAYRRPAPSSYGNRASGVSPWKKLLARIIARSSFRT